MRTYLQVPFREKNTAKSHGARWDAVKKSWYIEGIEDVTKLIQWMTDGAVESAAKPNIKPTKKTKTCRNNDPQPQRNITIGLNYVETISDELPWAR